MPSRQWLQGQVLDLRAYGESMITGSCQLNILAGVDFRVVERHSQRGHVG